MWLAKKYLQSKFKKIAETSPEFKKYYNEIVGCGAYDGSDSKRRIAEEKYDILKDQLGDYNPNTRRIFEENLSSGLPMTLVAVYAFVIGTYIEDTDYVPYGLNSDKVSEKVMAMQIMFPDYEKFVSSRHSGSEEAAIFALSANLIDCYIDTSEFFGL